MLSVCTCVVVHLQYEAILLHSRQDIRDIPNLTWEFYRVLIFLTLLLDPHALLFLNYYAIRIRRFKKKR